MPRLDRKFLTASALPRGVWLTTGTSSPRSASGPERGRPVCGRDDGANTQRMTRTSTTMMPAIQNRTPRSKPTPTTPPAEDRSPDRQTGHRPSTDIVPEEWSSRPAEVAEGEPVVMAQRVAVIGAGLMGSGIAQVSAVAGLEVVLRDI